MARRPRLSAAKDKLVEELRERFNISAEATKEDRAKALDDLRFKDPDQQWDGIIRNQRIAEGRPCLSFDRLNMQAKQLTNAQRENRPAMTVHPLNDEADQDTAEVLQGIIRHIEYRSAADQAYDTAFQAVIDMGKGFWRILTRYEDWDSFNQEIIIERIVNPFSVYLDPSASAADGSDIDWAIITTDMSAEEFKATWPDSELASYTDRAWLTIGDEEPVWFSTHESGQNGCRIVEYFKKERTRTKIHLMPDGSVVQDADLERDEEGKPATKPQDSRETTIETIKWYKCNGIEILEETTWPGKYIPIVPVYGDEFHKDGKTIYSGLIRNCKAEQMELNICKNNLLEVIGSCPRAPWVGPKGFVGSGDNKQVWQTANRVNYAYLEFENKDAEGNDLPPPIRQVAEPAIQALVQACNMAENDIKATNGQYDPSLGNKLSNDQSGIAIRSLQSQGSIGNYHYSDNLSRAIRLTGLIVIDLIAKVLTQKQVMRIVGLDDTHKLVTINGTGATDESGKPLETGCADDKGVARVFDVTKGKYDVTVSSGPSYQTKRAENLDMLFNLASKDPALMQQAGDLIVSQLDSPIAIQLRARLAKFIAAQFPGVIPPDPNDPNAQKQLLPQVAQAMAQDHQMIQMLMQKLQQAQSGLDKAQLEAQAKDAMNQRDNQTRLQIEEMRNHSEAALASFQHEVSLIHKKLDQNHQVAMQPPPEPPTLKPFPQPTLQG